MRVSCLKKRANLFFSLSPSNINRLQQKNGVHVRKKHLTKLRKNCQLHLKHVQALPWEIWGDRLSHQRSTYIYIRIAISTTVSNCLKNRQACSNLHHHTTCSKCPPLACTKISGVNELRQRIKNEWTVWITLFIEHTVGDVAQVSTTLRAC